MKELLSQFVGRVLVLIRALGPYAAIELLLPGGTIVALLYWWHRRRVRQLRAASNSDTCFEVQPSSESLWPWNLVRALSEAVSRATARLGVSRPIRWTFNTVVTEL